MTVSCVFCGKSLTEEEIEYYHVSCESCEIKNMTTESESALNVQVGGDHYKKMGEFQPWQVLPRWMTDDELRGFAKGTAIAYLARERDKGGIQDIDKAMHTLQLYKEVRHLCVSSGESELRAKISGLSKIWEEEISHLPPNALVTGTLIKANTQLKAISNLDET